MVEFKGVLKNYLIEKGFDIVKRKNEKRRFKARCIGETEKGVSCTWCIFAARIKFETVFQIQQLNKKYTHDRNTKTKNASMYWIANYF